MVTGFFSVDTIDLSPKPKVFFSTDGLVLAAVKSVNGKGTKAISPDMIFFVPVVINRVFIIIPITIKAGKDKPVHYLVKSKEK